MSLSVSGQDLSDVFTITMGAGSTAAVSPSGTARIRYHEGTDELQVSKNGAAYAAIGGAGGGTLEDAYNFGGAGAGNKIKVNQAGLAPVTLHFNVGELSAPEADFDNNLTILYGNAANDGIGIQAMSGATGWALNVNATQSTKGIQVTGVATALQVTSTEGSVVTGTTFTDRAYTTWQSLGPSSPTLRVEADANSFGQVSWTGGTTPLRIRANNADLWLGGINPNTVRGELDTTKLSFAQVEITNPAGGSPTTNYLELGFGGSTPVAPANRGRIRYNTATNTLQFSNNTGAYADIGTGGVTTLDAAYTAGQSINIDSGPIALTQSVETTGSPSVMTHTGAAHTTLTNADLFEVDWNFARTVQFAGNFGGPVGDIAQFRLQAPTISASLGPFTVADASVLYVDAAPTQGPNATLNNRNAILAEGRVVARADNTDLALLLMNKSSIQRSVNLFEARHGALVQATLDADGHFLLSPQYTGNGSSWRNPHFSITSQARSNIPVSTELTGMNLDFTGGWSYGGVAPATTQRVIRVQAPTILGTNAAAQTAITTLYIDNAPRLSGANPTATNAYGAWFDNVNAITDTTAVDTAATVYISGAPSSSGGGSIGEALSLLIGGALASGETSTKSHGLLLRNSTASTSGTQQWSPMVMLEGTTWDSSEGGGAENEPTIAGIQYQTASKAGGGGNLHFLFSIDGTAFSSAGNIDEDGVWTSASNVVVGGNLLPSGSVNDIGTGSTVFRNIVAHTSLTVNQEVKDGVFMSPILNLNSAAHTNLSDGNAIYADFDIDSFINFVTVSTDQTAVRFLAPTYTADTVAQVIPNAATVYINAAPGVSGGNVSITNPRALHVDAGAVLFDDALTVGGAFAHTGSTFGVMSATPAAQQTSGADLTNNVTAGGTNDQIDNWTDLTTYSTDAAAIRNAIYQLARKLKQVNDGLRTYGLLS